MRGLFINRTGANDHEIGLFGSIDKTGELAVSDLGVEEADIRGNEAVGILVGESTGASFSKVWTTGKVFGQVNIGGLAGQFIGGGATVSIEMSWSAADVEGNSFNVGGLIGQNSSTGQDSSDGVQNGLDDVHVNVVDNWAAGNVIGNQNVGGFAGNDDGVDHTRNWSSGAVTVFSNSASGGFAGFNISGSNDTYASSYWNEDTSDLTTSAGGKGVVVQTLTVSDFGGEAESAAWDFGDSDIADGVADFPLLKSSERPLQAVYLARALTRLLGVSDAAEIVAAAGTTITARGIRLDTNGLANNERTNGTSTPSCSVINGELRAETNYNRVTAKLILMTSGDEAFVAAGGCSARIVNSTGEFAATLRLEISAPATLDDPARSLTTDYALRIAPDLSGQARAKFLAEIASGDREWLGGDSDDWDRDGVLNPYDWTPTSVIIGGVDIGVNLNLDDADGTAGLPWPIYNVWQLQAIDGETVAIDGLVSDSVHDAAASNLFGDSDAERLGAHYRLMADIDASPTRDWARQFVAGRANHALGFQPLGWNDSIFQGSFDGQGREIRNLFMRRGVLRAGPLTSDQGINAGLFAVVGAGATVRNLGLRDLDFRSDAGRFIGGLAGKVSVGLVSLVWATGVVEGEETIGGLAGLLEGGGEIVDSWFVGKVEGIEDTGGGLVGASETGRIRDSWALAELSRGESNFDSNPIGGLIGRNGIASVLDNSWAIGLPPAEEGAGLIGDNQAQDSVRQAYWDRSSSTVKAVGGVVPARVFSVDTMATVTDTDAEWSTTAWNFGRSDNNAADYPFLRGSEGFWPGRQALAFADFQTRLVADSGETLAMDGERIIMRIDAPLTLRLDTNGLAANDPGDTDPTPTPSCSKDGESVRAETNYNNVTVWLQSTGGGELALSPSSNCVVEFTYPLSAQDRTAPVSLLLTIATAESSLSRSHAVVASPFSARLPTRVFAPFDAAGETALLTVSLAFGALTPFSAALRDNASVVVESARDTVLLLRAPSATALFARDNESFTVTLRVFEESTGFTETQAIEIRSSPRPFNEPTMEFELPYEQATVGARIFGDAGLSIWHNEDSDIYSLEQAESNFGVSSSLPVTLAASLALGIYDLTLRLKGGGVTASRPLRLIVSDPAAVLEEFLARIRAGDIVWRGDGDADDWDGDGIDNPYDWTPAKVKDLPAPLPDSFDSNPWYQETRINLTLFGSNPRPIYNVWQLQAIDGVSVSADGAVRGNFGFFGGSEGFRLDGQYRLAVDIDATPTRNWKGTNEGGFRPIGGARPANHRSQSFSGSLDGAGYEIRGLSVSVARDRHAGVFSDIHTNGSVASLHFADLFVSGGGDDNDYVGGLAGSSYGNVSLVGISGRVVRSGNGPIGGLMGVSAGGRIDETWFAGEVEAEDGVGGENGIGGLIGHSGFSDEAAGGANMNNNWAHARVEEKDDRDNLGWVGGLIGGAFAGIFENGWTGGEVVGDRPGAFIGRLDSEFADTNDPTASPPTEFSRGYFDSSTSTATKTVGFVSGDDLVEVFAVDTMVTVSVSRWSNAVWNFGATISDGPADYPFLRRYEAMRPGAQAVAYAARQIRLLAGGLEVKRGEAFVLGAGDVLTLDTNGLAVDHAPSPSCAPGSNSGEVRAAANYNGVTVILRATNGVSLSLSATGDCVVEHSGEGEAFSILAAVSAGETAQTLSFSFTSAAPSRFFPQPLLSTATANVDDAAQLIFVEDIAAGKVDWRIIDPYDWTPTSVTVGGAAIEVNLTLGGADGSAANPWPIYNIWQLQAVGGVSVAADGALARGDADLFGAEAQNAHYRLMSDIDATPTRGWNGGEGFSPIARFGGSIDGGGKVVRGLFINAPKTRDNAFIQMLEGTIASLGFLDARFAGAANNGGGFAYRLAANGLIEASWFAGEVGSATSGGIHGGLVGEQVFCETAPCLVAGGWFAGDVGGAAASKSGGLVGRQGAGGGAVRGGWSFGAVRGAQSGGLIGAFAGGDNDGYWSVETSGVAASAGGAGVFGIDTLQTVTAFAGATEFTVSVSGTRISIDFGDSDLSDFDADFPILAGDEVWKNWQRLGVASGLTRVYGGIENADMRLTAGETVKFAAPKGDFVVRIDTNGEAPAAASNPTCAIHPTGDGWNVDPRHNKVSIRFTVEDGNGFPTGTRENCQVSISDQLRRYTIVVTFTAGEGAARRTLIRRYPIVR